MSRNFQSLFELICLFNVLLITNAFSSPPILGLGAIFLKPAGIKTTPSLGDSGVLLEAANFFVDAFWTGKVGGGAKVLTETQKQSLSGNQLLEFQRRYGPKMGRDRRAELLICRNGKGEIMGVVGIELDGIPADSLKGPVRQRGPLMSNLAVGRKFRRRGIAEELVQQAEVMARKEWGYNECWLYVERRNTPALRLYQKLGYRRVWQDDDAKTLLPTTMGNVQNTDTVIVCMKKRLSGGMFGRFLP